MQLRGRVCCNAFFDGIGGLSGNEDERGTAAVYDV
jgi:hypothetical protein